jgi:cobalt/nickel transport system permease protein
MHLPDGFLSTPVAVACATLAVAGVGAAGSRSRALLGSRAVPQMGVTAAFIFAAQMINFPVAGGTSGHLVGGTLAAVLLGPSAAVVAMTAVLVMQCFVFGDGGLLALGANVLNMGVLHPIVGFAVYRVLIGRAAPGTPTSRARSARPPSAARRIGSLAFASWVATVVASAACAGELALSRVAAPGVVFSAMVAIHIAIGLGEAVIAALVLAAVLRLRPEVLQRSGPRPSAGSGSIAVLGLATSLGLALFLSPFACKWPDGLERLAQNVGLEPRQAQLTSAPLRDYLIPGVKSSLLATSLAAAAGTLLVFGLSFALGAWLAAPSRS